MHITEHTGRGVPKITEVYGRENIHFHENSIAVLIPYNRLGSEVYAVEDRLFAKNETKIPPVKGEIPLVKGEIPPVTTSSGTGIQDRLLLFCTEAKGILEIAEFLGYKDKKTVRKYLNPLIEQGRIARTIPDSPNSRFQKYITIK